MPTYMYRAMTKQGQIVRNRVEANSRQSLIKTLKTNDLLPIAIEQLAYRNKKAQQKRKKNIKYCRKNKYDFKNLYRRISKI